ncbi:class I SAM-dependent methyltransferase [soil metagenome]
MATRVSDNWERGDAYEQYVGRWSRQVAPRFLDWLAASPGLRWLDVGCGTGALTATIVDHAAPASVDGVEPSAGFLTTARERLGESVALHQGDAATIPLPDDSVDMVVSALVLNFVPDIAAALAEMRRVVVAGGTVAGYVWDYGGDMQFMRYFWDAAVALDPDAAELDEAVRFPMTTPDGLAGLFAAAGLSNVVTVALDIHTSFADFDALWAPFLSAQGPAPTYLASLDTSGRDRLREKMRLRVPVAADGSIDLIARAWAVRGISG